MEGERRPRLCNVSSYLMCVLCGGHYVDATSIVECLHAFCRSCIVKHLETSRFCPMCDVQVHKTKPLLSIRQDHHLQRLVYKMVPGLFHKELARLRDFYMSIDKSTDFQKVKRDYSKDLQRILQHFSPDENISVSLEYHDSSRDDENTNASDEHKEEVQKRYLNCPAAFSIRYLKKFIRMKYGLKNDQRVDIYYQNQQIADPTTIMDVAYDFHWNRNGPMKFGFQILERHTVTVSNTNRVTITEGPSSSALEGTLLNANGLREVEMACSEQAIRPQNSDLSRKKLRDDKSSDIPEESSPAKRARCDRLEVEIRKENISSTPLNGITNVQDDADSINTVHNHGQELIESMRSSENVTTVMFTADCKGGGSQATSPGGVEDTASEVIVEEDVMEEVADSIEEEHVNSDVIQDIEEVVVDIEGEPSQDFILQDEQNIDISEDLEEDDDEDRLRICDPEEVSEDKNGEENQEVERVENNSVEPEVQEEKLENFVEEEAEVVRKENKIRKKNKKGKHHHRHKRDYSPAPEATIVSDDNSNIMKLRLKVINTGNENNQGKNKNKLDDKTHRSSDGQSSPKQSHRNYMIAQENENNSIRSPSVSNNDDDSRNSQSTDDHDVRSVASSKEGQDDTLHSSKGSLLNGCNETGKTKTRDLTTKEKLLQMRQVRHKNITPPPPRASVTTTISKVSAEEASRKTQKSPILLTSPSSSLTVSKVTAEEKMKMMTSNSFENNRPSLEIIMVNNPNALSKINDGKSRENQSKQKSVQEEISKCSPIVKLMKNNNINSLVQKQNALSVSKVKSTSDVTNRNVESLKGVKDDKGGSDRARLADKRSESFGALDLSGKSTRSSGSSPASDGSNCPSPNQTALSMSQPLINRHLSSMNSPHRSSSNSPPVPKGAQHPTSMWGEPMAKTDTTAKMQIQEGMLKRQMANNQQKTSSPQRRLAMSLPAGSASPRASSTELKIPTPNVGLASKFINRPKEPPSSLVNKLRLAGVDFNKPIVALTRPMPRGSSGRYIPATAFPNMLQSQSAAVAKKQAGINGRNVGIPPPPPAIPISTLYKLESMAKKYDMEKMARGLSKANKTAATIPSS